MCAKRTCRARYVPCTIMEISKTPREAHISGARFRVFFLTNSEIRKTMMNHIIVELVEVFMG